MVLIVIKNTQLDRNKMSNEKTVVVCSLVIVLTFLSPGVCAGPMKGNIYIKNRNANQTKSIENKSNQVAVLILSFVLLCVEVHAIPEQLTLLVIR